MEAFPAATSGDDEARLLARGQRPHVDPKTGRRWGSLLVERMEMEHALELAEQSVAPTTAVAADYDVEALCGGCTRHLAIGEEKWYHKTDGSRWDLCAECFEKSKTDRHYLFRESVGPPSRRAHCDAPSRRSPFIISFFFQSPSPPSFHPPRLGTRTDAASPTSHAGRPYDPGEHH